MMATFDRELKLFDLELNRNFQKIIAFNRCRSFNHKNIKTRSQAQNDIVLGSEYLDLTSRSDLQYNGVDLQSVGWVFCFVCVEQNENRWQVWNGFDRKTHFEREPFLRILCSFLGSLGRFSRKISLNIRKFQ